MVYVSYHATAGDKLGKVQCVSAGIDQFITIPFGNIRSRYTIHICTSILDT